MDNRQENFLEALKEGRLYLDGGMGSLMQKRAQEAGLDGIGTVPEYLGITHPELIRGIHEDYVRAGADIILSCTFGANAYKLGQNPEHSQEDVVCAAIRNARSSGARFVAMDIGPIGSLIGDLGDVSEAEAYEIFKDLSVLGEQEGADLIVIETMTDLKEARLALLAAKENTDLPVLVSMTFEDTGRTMTGSTPEVCAVVLDSLGADIIGTNCSTGPKDMAVNARRMHMVTDKPIVVQPNAGLPVLRDGKTVYDIDSDTFSDIMQTIASESAAILGGCCGTEPDHIRKTCEKTREIPIPKHDGPVASCLASAYKLVEPGQGLLAIGESINPTANKKLRESLKDGQSYLAAKLAVDQTKAGADILDVNVGVAGIDEAAIMEEVIRAVSEATTLPLQIDSTKSDAIERALRAYPGRAIVNSVNGHQESMDAIFPLIRKYGAKVVALTLDEHGIPDTADEKIAIAEKIIDEAAKYGIPKDDIVVDCLCMTASTKQDAAMETLRAIRRCREELGVNTTLGVSNISFGLPMRSVVNAAFLSQAMSAGLNMPIISVLDENVRAAIDIFRVIDGEDVGCAAFTRSYRGKTSSFSGEGQSGPVRDSQPADPCAKLATAVVDGMTDDVVSLTRELLKTEDPMDIVNRGLIRGLDEIGVLFETGEAFLPNLLFAAEAVQGGFELIKDSFGDAPRESAGRVLLATVEGDVHDIGKNILKVIMENYGYEIVDLGKDVKVEDVVASVIEYDAALLGLSALMTTTVGAMERTIEEVRKVSPKTKIMVGGAVMTEEFSKEIGADYYGKDAKAGVDIARRVFTGK